MGETVMGQDKRSPADQRGTSPVAKELSVYLIGWRAYFGFCETPSVLRALDQWIRRRLRAIELARGASAQAHTARAARTAYSCARPGCSRGTRDAVIGEQEALELFVALAIVGNGRKDE